MPFTIKDSISWNGKIDWELKKFHGEEYSTHRGSSYNSYLVKDEKIALIDTVWGKFSSEFLANLKKEVPLETIDFVIANHAESDHSGALPELMRHIPDTPIYCTSNGVNSLKGDHQTSARFVDWHRSGNCRMPEFLKKKAPWSS
jgi:anaerobic nitric oxide reductase flavorubredoxin